MLNVGDVVEFVELSEYDTRLGLHLGERAIIQPIDSDCDVPKGCLMVCVENYVGGYFVFPEQVKKVESANLDTLFKAFNVEDPELLEAVKNYVNLNYIEKESY